MSVNIHPLQEASIDLLNTLYADMQLPATRAIVTMHNGYYPSIEEILSTLSHYKDKEPVEKFVDANKQVIAAAENEIKIKKERAAQQSNQSIFGDIFSDVFSPRERQATPYQALKAVSLKAVEDAVADELSKLTGESLEVEIKSFVEKTEGARPGADLQIFVRKRQSNDF